MHDTLSTQRLAEALCRLLPQTQCRQCGFDGCAEYARAMALGTAPIHRCAPGGRVGVEKLAAATGQAAGDVDPEYGRELPFAAARIDAARCIGCRLCDAACPVGCITGLPKHLFAVIEPECTGCGLCMCACPVNAVEMVETGHVWSQEDAERARAAYERTRERHRRRAADRKAQLTRATADKSAVLMQALLKAQSLKTQK